MREKPTATHNRNARTDELHRHAGEHPAFDPGFVDANRTIWFGYPATWPACSCGLPALEDRRTCGDRACTGAL
jgi:hypothetical protein